MRRLRLLLFLLAGSILVGACGTDTSKPSSPEDPTSAEGAKSAWERAARQRSAKGKADVPPCSGVRVPDQSGFDKRIALTFDDGPEPSTTPRVLEVLAEHNAPATFFVLGSQVEQNPETYRQIVEQGHLVGNHTYTHRNMSSVSASSVRDELASTEESMTRLGPEPKFMRFPYGAADCQATQIAESMDYRVTGWHIDSADWCFSQPTGGVGHCSESTFGSMSDAHRDDMISYVMAQARRTQGGVLLMHDIKSFTAAKLDRLLTRLQNAGFEFVQLDNEEVFPKLNNLEQEDDEETRPWIGTPCGDSASSDSAVCTFDPEASCFQYPGDSSGSADSNSSETEETDPEPGETVHGFCTVPCEGYCSDLAGKATTFCVEMPGSPETGHCVSKATPENDYCDKIPGASPTEATRYVGDAEVPEATATVCLPDATQ